MADWSQLPGDLIAKISTHLHDESSIDLLRFRSVCATWRSYSIRAKRHRFSSNEFPIIPDHGNLNKLSGFRLSIRSIFLVSLPLPPPLNSYPPNQTHPNWLIKIDQQQQNNNMLFFNPLARNYIIPNSIIRVLDFMNLRVNELAHEYVLHYLNRNDVNDLYMEKVVILSNTNHDGDNDHFLLLTIHISGKLALLQSNHNKWIVIHDMPSPYDDVIAYKGNFYAVDSTGRIVTVQLEPNNNLELVADSVYGGDKKYLVESDGHLLLVDMYLTTSIEDEGIDFLDEYNLNFLCCTPERAVRFKVYQMDWTKMNWVEVNNLGDRLLFIGDNCTFSMSASELHMDDGLNRGNCVIFEDNFDCLSSTGEEERLANNTIGVFFLETGCIVPLRKCSEYSRLFWPPPQWLTPTIQEENHFEGQSSQ